MRSEKNLYAVIMAGGRGERFWPVGRRSRPKQMLPLLSEKSMIEEVCQRLFPVFAPENILVITNNLLVDKIRSILPIPSENVIGEPVGRDTAPCVALATAIVKMRNPNATMVVLPADHVVRSTKKWHALLLNSVDAAQNNVLVTLGVTPTFAATGYGYIHVDQNSNGHFKKVLEFKEKPDVKTAERFFFSGNYLWNSGMFIWRVETILAAFAKYCPDLAVKIEKWSDGGDFTTDFADCPQISVDYAILEKADNVLVGEISFYWNDIGSWSALRTVLPVDKFNNAVKGNVVTLDASNNVLWCDDNTLLGVVGMRDCAIIKSGNGLLVSPLSEEQRIKELIKLINDDQFL